MLNEDQKKDLDRLLDGDLPDPQRETLLALLETDQKAVDWLADRATLHAGLRQSMQRRGIEAKVLGHPEKSLPSHHRNRWNWLTPAAVAALLAALAASIFWTKKAPNETTFATIQQTRAALWESCELPTADGSRIGRGTLRLAEGLATLQFDSGAEVILEAPAELVLLDAMNCQLTKGTAVSDIPDTALGFRIKTPSADVVDYGTRFAVSVYQDTGEIHTQVIEGKVQIEYIKSGKTVELNTGQKTTVIGEVIDDVDREQRTIQVEPTTHGSEWTLLETIKDAYTGRVKGHESDVLLYVKAGVPQRSSFLGFDLSGIDHKDISGAELLLYFAPTGWGLASHVPDAKFSVYGIAANAPYWDESILRDQFPGEPQLTYLGSFTIPQGVQKGRFKVRSDALNNFLHKNTSSEVTFKVIRDTRESEGGGLVHGFASRRHPVLPAPTLAIRHRSGETANENSPK